MLCKLALTVVRWLISALLFVLPDPPSAYTQLMSNLQEAAQHVFVMNPFISWVEVKTAVSLTVTVIFVILFVRFAFWVIEMIRGK